MPKYLVEVIRGKHRACYPMDQASDVETFTFGLNLGGYSFNILIWDPKAKCWAGNA